MVRIMFTDPTNTMIHDDEHLGEGILSLFRKARNTIQIHGFSLTGFYDEETFDKPILNALKNDVKLQVFGHDKKEVKFITSIYRDYDVEGYYYKNPNEKSLYHIKAIIIDGLYVYIGSANLSKNALQNSAELGIFLENRHISESISKFTQHLIESELLVVV